VSKIDWSKAPEWADGHGLVAHHGITEVWISMEQYAVVGAEDRAYAYGGGTGDHRHNFTRGQVQYITPRPARWDGEGLPPVGTVCEVQTWVNREWRKTTVLAHHLGFAVHSWSTDGDDIQVEVAPSGDFRPFRTPEQIAAEELEDRLTVMSRAYQDATGRTPDAYVSEAFRALEEAGYRKQVAP